MGGTGICSAANATSRHAVVQVWGWRMMMLKGGCVYLFVCLFV
jgi:hypothetical protein